MIDENWMLIGLLALVFGALVAIAALSNRGSLNSIKNKTVGDGQYGTARWATEKEIRKSYRRVPFRPALWRKGEQLPEAQGLVLGFEDGSLRPQGTASRAQIAAVLMRFLAAVPTE